MILFGYDRAADSVIVGPVGFKKSVAPNVLEYGGETVVLSRRRTADIAEGQGCARPYMAPCCGEGTAQVAVAVAGNSIRKGA